MIFFDMDGVLAKYDRGGYNFEEEGGPDYLKKGYFLEREPDNGAVALFRKCLRVCPMNVDMLDDSRKRKNGTECILCCNCIKECPKKALDLK